MKVIDICDDYEILSNDCKIKWLENYKLLDTDIMLEQIVP